MEVPALQLVVVQHTHVNVHRAILAQAVKYVRLLYENYYSNYFDHSKYFV